MKNLRSILPISILLILSINSCSNTETDQSISTEQQVEQRDYQCPMKCEGDKVYPKEISCPVCNMDLVEVAQG